MPSYSKYIIFKILPSFELDVVNTVSDDEGVKGIDELVDAIFSESRSGEKAFHSGPNNLSFLMADLYIKI